MNHFHEVLLGLQKGTISEPTLRTTVKNAYPAQHAWLLDVARCAVCFHIGAAENVPKMKLIPELFRLPYPVIWLEGDLHDGLLGVLAVTVETGDIQAAVMNKRRGGGWQLVAIVEIRDVKAGTYQCNPVLLPSRDSSQQESLLNYAGNATGLLASTLMAMHCTNVQRISHPASKIRNTQRVRQGRVPLFSTWTLHLPGPVAENQPQGGTHASPRVHLRRGHPRRCASGKYTWVQPHVVGNKALGMVHKDYAATPALLSAAQTAGSPA